jgi:CheY-like chemotaxis protein
LTIIRSLVVLHGGTVEARSEGIGRGSEFVVRLPVLTPSTRGEMKTRQRATQKLKANLRLRVLVVDDNRDAAHMIADALDTVGHMTRTAHDGPTALLSASSFSPDVALLDLGLPVMDGYELAERLRSVKGLQALILVAVTGYGQDADRRRSRKAGFHAHIVKPVDLEELNRVLDKAARGRKRSGGAGGSGRAGKSG